MTVSREGDVALVTWRDGENRVNLDSLRRWNDVLDELELVAGPLAVVVIGEGRFFCNGLDLERFAESPAEFAATLAELKRTIGRLMVFPRYCVAALNGHTFAGGALLSCAFDVRVMRVDRGYWCMNEAEIGLALDEDLLAILTHRFSSATAWEAAMTARRYAAPAALGAGIVEHAVDEDGVLPSALEIAQRFASLDSRTLGQHKRLAHGALAAQLGYRA